MDPRRLLGLFLGESREHLAAAERLLDDWEDGAGAEPSSRELMRHAHSLKGMAMSMGFSSMEALAHALEDLFDPSAPPAASSRETAALAREALACIGAIVDAVERGASDDVPRARQVAAGLRAARERRGLRDGAVEAAAPAAQPARAPRGAAARWKIELLLYAASAVDAARTVAVLSRLRGLGAVEHVNPPLQAVRTGRFEGRLVLVLVSTAGRSRLERELQEMPEVACYNIQPLPRAAEREAARDRPVRWARVRADLLDEVLGKSLDLLHEHRRAQACASGAGEELARHLDRSGYLLKDLHASLTELRLVPFESSLQVLSRTVRELSRELGKPVRFEVEGGAIQLDRSVLDALTDPLRHMIRNALDHGIESAAERAARGKPAEARLSLRAERRGEWLRVALEDDGRGFDAGALKRAAVERGLLAREAAERLPDREAYMLSTLPSLSTASATSRISGRGVGMDVVRRNVERLGGRLGVRSAAGRGTRIDLAVPLTLALIPALLLRCAGETFALPVSRVLGGLGWSTAARGAPPSSAVEPGLGIATVRLAARLGLASGSGTAARETALLIEVERGKLALIVEEVLGSREILVRPLGPPLNELRAFSGAALLEDGSIAFVLDPEQLAAAPTPV